MWKYIPNTAEKYLVNEVGQIRYHKNIHPRKLFANRDGYLGCVIYFKGKIKILRAHRAVAEAFLGQSNLCVNHINGDKSDNAVNNLEYLMVADNNRHRETAGLSNRKRSKRLSKKDVLTIRKLFLSHNNGQIARIFGTTRYVIRDIKTGRTYKKF